MKKTSYKKSVNFTPTTICQSAKISLKARVAIGTRFVCINPTKLGGHDIGEALLDSGEVVAISYGANYPLAFVSECVDHSKFVLVGADNEGKALYERVL